MALAYTDPSLQKPRVSVIDPFWGMMACLATEGEMTAYEPLNL